MTTSSRTFGDPPELHVVGDFAWDVMIQTDDQLLRGGDTFGEVTLQPGGSAANVAVWATRCGVRTHFVGKVGRDDLGRLAHQDLAAEGVVNHLVDSLEQATGSVAVFVDHTGERSMVSGHGADHYLLLDDLPHGELARARHLHITGWSLFVDPPRSAARAAAQEAKTAGASLSLDPSSFQLIDSMGVDEFLAITTDLGIDLILPNRDEAAVLTGSTDHEEVVRRLTELYPGADVVLKLDADGALLFDGETTTHVPARRAELVDATGAGDSFAGAFLARRLSGDDAETAAAYAVQVSAWVIERLGARPKPDAALSAIMRP